MGKDNEIEFFCPVCKTKLLETDPLCGWMFCPVCHTLISFTILNKEDFENAVRWINDEIERFTKEKSEK
jgi:uncharacterized Zn finger protein (UPF0148 family)